MKDVRIRQSAQCARCKRWFTKGSIMQAEGRYRVCQYRCAPTVTKAEAAAWLADLAESRDAQREVEELDVLERKGVAS